MRLNRSWRIRVADSSYAELGEAVPRAREARNAQGVDKSLQPTRGSTGQQSSAAPH